MKNRLWKIIDWGIAALIIIIKLSAILASIIVGYAIQARIIKLFL